MYACTYATHTLGGVSGRPFSCTGGREPGAPPRSTRTRALTFGRVFPRFPGRDHDREHRLRRHATLTLGRSPAGRSRAGSVSTERRPFSTRTRALTFGRVPGRGFSCSRDRDRDRGRRPAHMHARNAYVRPGFRSGVLAYRGREHGCAVPHARALTFGRVSGQVFSRSRAATVTGHAVPHARTHAALVPGRVSGRAFSRTGAVSTGAPPALHVHARGRSAGFPVGGSRVPGIVTVTGTGTVTGARLRRRARGRTSARVRTEVPPVAGPGRREHPAEREPPGNGEPPTGDATEHKHANMHTYACGRAGRHSHAPSRTHGNTRPEAARTQARVHVERHPHGHGTRPEAG
ncbi:hypothetical protein BCL76_1147 [Streptomyces sp. CG 926]|nr:hypothetical protein BCL76_1147 [Streptomyces sp. CG 926]